MGINFGRMAQGIATGYLGAAIKDKESKDNARLEVVKAAGIDYYTNQLPAHKKTEANRASAYKQLTTILGSEEAVDFLDANGILVGDGKDVERVQKMLEDKNIKPDAFKDYVPTSNYGDRYKQRQSDFESRFDVVKKTFDMQGSGVGPSTIKGLLTKEAGDMTRTEEVTTPAVEPQQIEGTPIMTSGTPERTEEVTTTLPRSTADSAMSEFFIPKTTVSNLGKENDIASSLSSYRGFGEGISIDPVTKNVRLSFGGSKNTEYNAMKQVLDQLGSQYEQADGKVNLTAASAEADRILYDQTQGIIKNNIVTGYSEASDGKNIISSATGFNETFNSDYPDARSKKIALINHMQSLGSKQEQLYFALSFPADLKFDDGKLVQGILTKAVQ
jgi:hypothetical protein